MNWVSVLRLCCSRSRIIDLGPGGVSVVFSPAPSRPVWAVVLFPLLPPSDRALVCAYPQAPGYAMILNTDSDSNASILVQQQ